MDYVLGWCLYLLIAAGVVGAITVIGFVVGCFCAAGTIERTR